MVRTLMSSEVVIGASTGAPAPGAPRVRHEGGSLPAAAPAFTAVQLAVANATDGTRPRPRGASPV